MDSVNKACSNPDWQPKPEVVEEWAGEIENRGISGSIGKARDWPIIKP